ncbi:MAG: efflux RND transporter periplasmic adaptor subunit [Deltaproteobacteria bacterium]|nr:efflux RND transporter periplasmic adaptor subunit [Deltaproteobacteria bacterium]
MARTRTLAIVLGCLVGVPLLARTGVAFWERLASEPLLEPPPVPVAVVRVEPAPFERTVAIAGTLEPVRSVDVFPKVGGRVVRVYAGLGDRVQAGQPLASVEATEYALQAGQAEAGLSIAGFAAETARRSLTRLDEVRERLGSDALSQQDYEEARVQAEGAATQAEVARYQRDLARRMVENATMTSPIDGVVSRVDAREGAMVGSEYPAFHVDDLSSFVVRCQVGDADLPWVEPGQRVRLRTDTHPGLVLAGTVAAVSPTLDAMTRRAPVEIEVPNPGGAVVGNLFTRGEIVVGVESQALVLPQETVERSEEGDRVRLARDDVVATVPVTVVGQSGETVAVNGLSPGDAVIVPGAQRLGDGERVRVVHPGLAVQ